MSGDRSGKCPKCGEYVDIDKFCEVGDTVFCQNCDADLQIKNLSPVRLSVSGTSGYEGDSDIDEDYEDTDEDEWDD